MTMVATQCRYHDSISAHAVGFKQLKAVLRSGTSKLTKTLNDSSRKKLGIGLTDLIRQKSRQNIRPSIGQRGL